MSFVAYRLLVRLTSKFVNVSWLTFTLCTGHVEILCVSASGRVVLRQGELQSAEPSYEEPADTDSSIHLPLLNPAKALMSRSTDHIVDESKRSSKSDLLLFRDDIDLGSLALDGSLCGVTAFPSTRGSRCLAWTPEELIVGISFPLGALMFTLGARYSTLVTTPFVVSSKTILAGSVTSNGSRRIVTW